MSGRIIILCCPLLVFTSIFCGRVDHRTYNYKELKFDTNEVAIFAWDTTMGRCPAYSSPMPLRNEDLVLVDSLLKGEVASFNKTTVPELYKKFNDLESPDSLLIYLNRYRRQYFPYKNEEGDRIVVIICSSLFRDDWKTVPYILPNGGGLAIVKITINLSKAIACHLEIGGWG